MVTQPASWVCFRKCKTLNLLYFFFSEQKDKTEPFDVEEVVQEMPREQREALWSQLDSLLREILMDLPPDRWEEDAMQQESALDPVSLSVTSRSAGRH